MSNKLLRTIEKTVVKNYNPDLAYRVFKEVPTIIDSGDLNPLIKVISSSPIGKSLAVDIAIASLKILNDMMRKSNKAKRSSLKAYEVSLNSLKTQLESDDLTPKERKELNEQLLRCSDSISRIYRSYSVNPKHLVKPVNRFVGKAARNIKRLLP